MIYFLTNYYLNAQTHGLGKVRSVLRYSDSYKDANCWFFDTSFIFNLVIDRDLLYICCKCTGTTRTRMYSSFSS